MLRVVAVILAGGTGSRAGFDVPKQYAELAGRPVLEHSIATFATHDDVDAVIVVAPRETLDRAIAVASGYDRVSAVVAGGDTRAASAHRGIEAAAQHLGADGRVLIHDAARPLVTAATVTSAIDALADADAVAVTVPESDTVVAVDVGTVSEQLDRHRLHRCQTPQGFRLGTIRQAHELAAADPDFEPTDDCGVVLRYLPDVAIRVVPGTPDNIKITHAEDLAVAELLLSRRGGGARSGTPTR